MALECIADRALLIESDESERALEMIFLQKVGVRHVVEARDAIAGFNLLLNNQKPFDVVIAEANLAGVSGFRLLQAVRCNDARPARPDTCFLLTSKAWQPPELALARQLDVSGVIVKPFDPAKLKQQLMIARRRVFPLDIDRYRAAVTP